MGRPANTLTPSQFWQAYVGATTPQEFMAARPRESRDQLHAVAQDYVAGLPSLYGVPIRNRSWKLTFAAYSHKCDEVAMALREHLEYTRDEWDLEDTASAASPPQEPSTTQEAPASADPAPQTKPPTEQWAGPDTPQAP